MIMLVHCPVRNGGGIGEGSIRKIAYFQSSVDPSLSGNKVWMVHTHTCTCVVLCVYCISVLCVYVYKCVMDACMRACMCGMCVCVVLWVCVCARMHVQTDIHTMHVCMYTHCNIIFYYLNTA